jgi:hypothetical protein
MKQIMKKTVKKSTPIRKYVNYDFAKGRGFGVKGAIT